MNKSHQPLLWFYPINYLQNFFICVIQRFFFSGVCSTDSDCESGNKCSGWGGKGFQCQPLSGKGGSCTYSSGCQSGLQCNGLTCYDPNDPCKCVGSGKLGNLCGDWDASGFRWCYVVDGPACKAKGGSVTSGSGGYWKQCTGND